MDFTTQDYHNLAIAVSVVVSPLIAYFGWRRQKSEQLASHEREKEKEIQTTKQKLEEAEQRGQQYLGQISNLLSKIPVGSSQAPQSIEQKIEEIKNRSWQK